MKLDIRASILNDMRERFQKLEEALHAAGLACDPIAYENVSNELLGVSRAHLEIIYSRIEAEDSENHK